MYGSFYKITFANYHAFGSTMCRDVMKHSVDKCLCYSLNWLWLWFLLWYLSMVPNIVLNFRCAFLLTNFTLENSLALLKFFPMFLISCRLVSNWDVCLFIWDGRGNTGSLLLPILQFLLNLREGYRLCPARGLRWADSSSVKSLVEVQGYILRHTVLP